MGTDGDGWEAPRSRGRLPLPLLAVLLLAGVALVASLLSADDEGTELTVEDVDDGDDAWPDALPAADVLESEWATLDGDVPSVAWTAPVAAVWTGREVLVFGVEGEDMRGIGVLTGAGGRELAASPLSPREGAAAVWIPAAEGSDSGSGELLVWGGRAVGADAGQLLNDGARYDPQADAWTLLPDGPLPGATDAHAVWTGRQVVVGGGAGADGPTARLATFDPSEGTWAEVAAPFGDAAIVALVQSPDIVRQGPVAIAATGEVAALRTDGVWRPLRDVPAPLHDGAAAATAGNRIALWTGGDDVAVPGRLLLLNPVNGRWAEAPPAPVGQVHQPLLVGGALGGPTVVLGLAEEGRPAGAVVLHGDAHDDPKTWWLQPDPPLAGPPLGGVWTDLGLVVIGREEMVRWRLGGALRPLAESVQALVHVARGDMLTTVDVDARTVRTSSEPAAAWPFDAVGDWLLVGGAAPRLLSADGETTIDLGNDLVVPLAAGEEGVWLLAADGGVRHVAVDGDLVGAEEPLAHPVPDGWSPLFGLADGLVLADRLDGQSWQVWDPRTGAVLHEGDGMAVAAGERTVAVCTPRAESDGRCGWSLVDVERGRVRQLRREGGLGSTPGSFAPGDTHLALPYLEEGVVGGLEILDLADQSTARVPLGLGPPAAAWHPDGGWLFAGAVPLDEGRVHAIRVGDGQADAYVVPLEAPVEGGAGPRPVWAVPSMAVTRAPR